MSDPFSYPTTEAYGILSRLQFCYPKFGFEYTGEVLGDDLEMNLAFWPGVFHILLDLTIIRLF